MNENELPRRLTKEDTGVDMELIYNSIANGAKEAPLWSLKEADFCAHFLPVFAGEEESDQKMADWARMAGGPNRWVRVTDIAGRQLFLVPPLQSTYSINPGAPGLSGVNAADIIGRYRALGLSGRAALANDYLKAHMTDYIKRGTEEENLYEISRAWSDIFDRYGIVVKGSNDTTEAAEEPVQQVLGFDPI